MDYDTYTLFRRERDRLYEESRSNKVLKGAKFVDGEETILVFFNTIGRPTRRARRLSRTESREFILKILNGDVD